MVKPPERYGRRLDGINAIAVCGAFGSGKTLMLIDIGLELANRLQKKLVVNFSINEKVIRAYCWHFGLHWFARFGRIIVLDSAKPGWFDSIFKYESSVVCLDEGGMHFFAQQWKGESLNLRDIFQVRHYDIHLLLAFQYVDQINKLFRETFQYWVLCWGVTKYSTKLRAPELIMRVTQFFTDDKFHRMNNDDRIKNNGFRKWLMCDRLLFEILSLEWFLQELFNLHQILRGRVTIESRHKWLFACFSSKKVVGKKCKKIMKYVIYNSTDIKEKKNVLGLEELFFIE